MMINKHIVAVIPARGKSKEIPRKNIKLFCGKPLVAWSIEQAKESEHISSFWVSSDDPEILEVAKQYGANPIVRPGNIAGDNSPSDHTFIHALKHIWKNVKPIDMMVGIQATSPLREPVDFDKAIDLFVKEKYDSLFSSTKIKDHFVWKRNANGEMDSVNYDCKNRPMRQIIKEKFIENGSFYLFTPDILMKNDNRLGGKVGTYVMDEYKQQQIDSHEDFKICELLMEGFGLVN